MPKSKTIENDELRDILFSLFRDNSYAQVTLSDISVATGLAKPSLYHRFPGGKEEMASIALTKITDLLDSEVSNIVNETNLTPETRFNKIIKILDHAHQGGMKGCILNSLSLGSSDSISNTLNLSYEQWHQSLSILLQEKGFSKIQIKTRIDNFLISYEGSLVLSKITGNNETFKRILKEASNTIFD